MKKSKKINTTEIIKHFALPDITGKKLSYSFSYGFILGLSLLLTGLLLGASQNIESVVSTTAQTKSPAELQLERDVKKMVVGYPIEKMIPYIATQDRETAAFIVGIAKKESNWGKRVPRKDGEDCYNYWGYRGEGSRGIAMGHGCFGSKKEAVSVISKRLDSLINEYNRDTASELVVWKCGYSCEGHSNESVAKWIQDVDYYATQVNDTKEIAEAPFTKAKKNATIDR